MTMTIRERNVTAFFLGFVASPHHDEGATECHCEGCIQYRAFLATLATQTIEAEELPESCFEELPGDPVEALHVIRMVEADVLGDAYGLDELPESDESDECFCGEPDGNGAYCECCGGRVVQPDYCETCGSMVDADGWSISAPTFGALSCDGCDSEAASSRKILMDSE